MPLRTRVAGRYFCPSPFYTSAEVAEVLKTYQLLQQLLANTPDVVFFKDRQSRYLEVNEAFAQLAGMPRMVLLGSDAHLFLPSDVAELVIREDKEVMESGESIRRESWVEYPDGRQALMDTVLAPIKESDGEICGIMGIGRDVTGFINATAELRDRNDGLTKSNRELETLLYHVAHDLRSPLASLSGLVDIMRSEKDQSKLLDYLDMQAKTIERMDRFIQDVVNLNKGRTEELKVEPVDVEAMFWGIVDQCRFLPGATTMDFKFERKGDAPFYTDLCRLSMILTNLVSNGLRYQDRTKDNNFLHMELEVTPGMATIQLKDNGIGIAPEHRQRIFEMFFRANNQCKGSGIGLYIVKETLAKLGGSISVESTLGEGTTFIVELPNLENN